MLKKWMRWIIFFWALVGLFQGCITSKAYKTAMELGSQFESRQQYIDAYEAYKAALVEEKDDKTARAKLEALGKKIAEDFTLEGNTALKKGRLKDAGTAFDNALKYSPGHVLATLGKKKQVQEQSRIDKEYNKVKVAVSKNEWIDALALLHKIEAVYKDDADLSNKIAETKEKGYEYYNALALEARKGKKYKDAVSYFKKAEELRPGKESRQKTDEAQKLVQADEYYRKALGLNARNSMISAFSALVEAKKITSSHEDVNALYKKLLPAWSAQAMAQGMALLEKGDSIGAFEFFNSLYEKNPDFPNAAPYYQKTREIVLKFKYQNMVDRLIRQDGSGVLARGHEIEKIAPKGFLYSQEMSANIPLVFFNLFYQRGLHFMNTGQYGKAILAFRSAEDQLGETTITRDSIKKAMENVAKTTQLNVAFWNFNYENGEAGVSQYASQQLKKELKSKFQAAPLKNIVLKYDIITEDEMRFRGDTDEIDWGLIQSKACNALITGKIESLRIDDAKNSTWETRVHKKRKIIDNKVYLNQVMKLAQLKNAQMNKLPELTFDGGTIPRKWYKREINKIEDILPGISPKVEADVEEKHSYQVEKYIMKAIIKMELTILYQNGAQVWPAVSYEDEFQIEDLVIAPDLESEIPLERAGDPLTLPSKYEFTQMALDHIISTNVLPDLEKKLNNYGMRFYASGKKMYALDNSADVLNTGFGGAVEAYYRFLACYKDKGESDDKPEKVNEFLDRFVSQIRLLEE